MPWDNKMPDLKNNPTYLEPRVSAVENETTILMGSPKTKSWAAIQGQLTYTFGTDTYTLGQLTVYVGGVQQIPGITVQENNNTQFTLLVDASEITAGLNVVAVYR